MALLATQKAAITGLSVALVAAAGGGDKFAPAARGVFVVRNSDASSKTVTVVVPGTKYGQAIPDVPVVVAAGATAFIGPFDADVFNATAEVDVTYSAVTSVTVAYVEI